jgi:hypothetical protein
MVVTLGLAVADAVAATLGVLVADVTASVAVAVRVAETDGAAGPPPASSPPPTRPPMATMAAAGRAMRARRLRLEERSVALSLGTWSDWVTAWFLHKMFRQTVELGSLNPPCWSATRPNT